MISAHEESWSKVILADEPTSLVEYRLAYADVEFAMERHCQRLGVACRRDPAEFHVAPALEMNDKAESREDCDNLVAR